MGAPLTVAKYRLSSPCPFGPRRAHVVAGTPCLSRVGAALMVADGPPFAPGSAPMTGIASFSIDLAFFADDVAPASNKRRAA